MLSKEQITTSRHDDWRPDGRVQRVLEQIFELCPPLRDEIVAAHDHKGDLFVITHSHPGAVPDKNLIGRCWRENADWPEPDASVSFVWFRHVLHEVPYRGSWPAQVRLWQETVAALQGTVRRLSDRVASLYDKPRKVRDEAQP